VNPVIDDLSNVFALLSTLILCVYFFSHHYLFEPFLFDTEINRFRGRAARILKKVSIVVLSI
jgi:hypothetical protein